MLISELDSNTVVTITATDGDNFVKLESKVITTSSISLESIQKSVELLNFRCFTLLELIKEENMVINFLSSKVRCYLTAEKNTKPYQFSDVKLIKLNIPELGYCHIALCNDDTESFNRRHEFRLWLGCDALFKINDSKVPHKGVVKDLSSHGAGFILGKEYDIKCGDIVHLQFHDSIFNRVKKDWDEVLYKGIYRVVRLINMKNDRVLVGCIAEVENDDIVKFIVRKQREKLSVNGRGSLSKKLCDSDLVESLNKLVEST